MGQGASPRQSAQTLLIMYILGLSCFYHDSAACLLNDGRLVAAAQEERFTRIKHDPAFPTYAIRYCLEEAGINIDRVDAVGFYEKPLLKFGRLYQCFADAFPKGRETFEEAMGLWLGDRFVIDRTITAHLRHLSPTKGEAFRWDGQLLYSEHHRSHAASAFFPSPFRDAAILTSDGVGEWATSSMGMGRTLETGMSRIKNLCEMHYPDSLGMLYSAFTHYLGFRVNSGEYKVMGLAPYGEPVYADAILERMLHLCQDGSFRLNMEYFQYTHSPTMVTRLFEDFFGLAARTPEDLLTRKHFDVAASVQRVTETILLKQAGHLQGLTGARKLCMAGGVALNCVANGRILRECGFEDVWIQPAAGDAGGALGVCYHIWHEILGHKREREAGRSRDTMEGSFLGPSFSTAQIEEELSARGIPFRRLTEEEMLAETVRALSSEKVVGWFQGRMEFGPRALGARSIIGDPRSRNMQRVMNLKIKFRESFRPFAPSVLREHCGEWFDLQGRNGSDLGAPGKGYDSPYMLIVAPVASEHLLPLSPEDQEMTGIDKLNTIRSTIPSCTHVDCSARIHTVTETDNRLYHALLSRFHQATGVPILVNTSFNVRGELSSAPRATRCDAFWGPIWTFW
ncbi:carbamoyltransferase N-terminal domain-containing protein [Kamptonema cortianum]|nr:carbamoyltransferase N-terminal domain-containing protein [Kamptonema cortianum]